MSLKVEDWCYVTAISPLSMAYIEVHEGEIFGLLGPKDYNNTVDLMVDILGTISLDLKRDIIIVCMMICAVDGKISYKERKWIKQLIR